MILYMKCVCTSQQRLMAQMYNDLGYQVRAINKNPAWRKEAKQYDAKLPFTVVDETVVQL